MRRKDCDKGFLDTTSRSLRPRTVSSMGCAVAATLFLCVAATTASAASIRVWPTAVVTGENIRLSDLCEFKGFQRDSERAIRESVVTAAPVPGGSRLIHIDMVRSALRAAGANMATVRVGGATTCSVTRPSTAVAESTRGSNAAPNGDAAHGSNRRGTAAAIPTTPPASSLSLRQAVIAFFNNELLRYHGRAEVVFDHTSQSVLDLSGPEFEFRVRRRGGVLLGLTSLEVSVLAAGDRGVAVGKTVQRVPLAVRVSMVRNTVVARRSINQGATIRAADMDVIPMTFTRLDQLGLDGANLALGQRAKVFVPAGAMIEPQMIEEVPLVLRGQLVKLTSVAGGIRVTTTAKAGSDGKLGDVITVRAVDNKRVEFDAVVIAPGACQLGDVRPVHVAYAGPRGGTP